jgi:hypothetical protein
VRNLPLLFIVITFLVAGSSSKPVAKDDLQNAAFKVGRSHTKRSLNTDSSQDGDSSSGIPPWIADSISQPEEAEKKIGDRDSTVMRNLPLPS